VVFNARAMHNMLNPNQFTMYPNNCSGTSNKQSPEQEVPEVNQRSEVYTIYPNPTSKGFYVQGNSTDGTLDIKVVDLQGKIVLQQTTVLGAAPCYIPVDLATGIYLVNIVNNETTTKYNTKLEISNQ
jgi:Secretion system C-terminal sorting domain